MAQAKPAACRGRLALLRQANHALRCFRRSVVLFGPQPAPTWRSDRVATSSQRHTPPEGAARPQRDRLCRLGFQELLQRLQIPVIVLAVHPAPNPIRYPSEVLPFNEFPVDRERHPSPAVH